MTSKIFNPDADRVRPNSQISLIGSSANRGAINRPEGRRSLPKPQVLSTESQTTYTEPKHTIVGVPHA
jgi:hypothetical protein